MKTKPTPATRRQRALINRAELRRVFRDEFKARFALRLRAPRGAFDELATYLESVARKNAINIVLKAIAHERETRTPWMLNADLRHSP